MNSFLGAEEYDSVAIFVQPSRIRADGTSRLATPLQLDQHEMTTMNAKSSVTYCSGLRPISMQYELLSACAAELSAPGMSATDKDIVVEASRNTDPLRGRVGINLAGVLLHVVGVAFARPVSSDAV
eukprot:5816082-Pyramimonas_sp.AAC.1